MGSHTHRTTVGPCALRPCCTRRIWTIHSEALQTCSFDSFASVIGIVQFAELTNSTWVEWPLLVDVGMEYDISYKSTLFVKAAAGPVLVFTGDDQFAGGSFELLIGLQLNYE